tara:strand:- start:1581 stop:3005 length:1425 start_codon:yes stop_codon:yes gene_type:complete
MIPDNEYNILEDSDKKIILHNFLDQISHDLSSEKSIFDKTMTGFTNIRFLDKNNNIIENDLILHKLFTVSDTDKTDIKSLLAQTYIDFFYNYSLVILKVCEKNKCKNAWFPCGNECSDIAKFYLKNEIQSTFFFLNLLGNSFISYNSEKNTRQKIDIYLSTPTLNSITGNWDKDSKIFHLSKSQFSVGGKLIMGFGPSASGKTFWTKNAMKFLANYMNISNFPKYFLSVDGGIMRESSIIFQIIKFAAKTIVSAKGVLNLVSAGIKEKIVLNLNSIFNSNVVKKKMKIYLFSQNRRGVHLSLYVPETLVSYCFKTTKRNCIEAYLDYIKITKDKKWIALMIWQHKNGPCPFHKNFQCKGVMKSGTEREVEEGKKFSIGGYDKAIEYGNSELYRKTNYDGPHYRIRIHNSGGMKTNDMYTKSIIELDEMLYGSISENVKQNIENEMNCIILKLQDKIKKDNIYLKNPDDYIKSLI